MIIRKSLAEFLGTFALVFVGCGSIILAGKSGAFGLLGISLAFGAVVTLMVYLLGNISGAHINPAVSISLFLSNHLRSTELPFYLLAQFSGAILASIGLSLIFPTVGDLGSTKLNLGILGGLGVEFAWTFLLMAVIYFVAMGPKKLKPFGGLAIGLVIFLASIFAGPYTGASLNPARSLGPAIIEGNFDKLWFYMLAPVLGAILVVPIYRKFKKDE